MNDYLMTGGFLLAAVVAAVGVACLSLYYMHTLG